MFEGRETESFALSCKERAPLENQWQGGQSQRNPTTGGIQGPRQGQICGNFMGESGGQLLSPSWRDRGSWAGLWRVLVKESKENSPTPTTFLTPYHAGEVHASFACFQTLLSPHFPRPGFLIWQRNSTSILTFSFLLHLRLKKFNRDELSTGQVWK